MPLRKGSRRFNIPPEPGIGSGRPLTQNERQFLAEITRGMVAFIRERLRSNKDFWPIAERSNELRKDIGSDYLEEFQLLEPFKRREEVAARLVGLALAHNGNSL